MESTDGLIGWLAGVALDTDEAQWPFEFEGLDLPLALAEWESEASVCLLFAPPVYSNAFLLTRWLGRLDTVALAARVLRSLVQGTGLDVCVVDNPLEQLELAVGGRSDLWLAGRAASRNPERFPWAFVAARTEVDLTDAARDPRHVRAVLLDWLAGDLIGPPGLALRYAVASGEGPWRSSYARHIRAQVARVYVSDAPLQWLLPVPGIEGALECACLAKWPMPHLFDTAFVSVWWGVNGLHLIDAVGMTHPLPEGRVFEWHDEVLGQLQCEAKPLHLDLPNRQAAAEAFVAKLDREGQDRAWREISGLLAGLTVPDHWRDLQAAIADEGDLPLV